MAIDQNEVMFEGLLRKKQQLLVDLGEVDKLLKRYQPSVKHVSQVVVEPTGKTRRRRHRMSAADRKAVSERMRKYWAERRKTKNPK